MAHKALKTKNATGPLPSKLSASTANPNGKTTPATFRRRQTGPARTFSFSVRNNESKRPLFASSSKQHAMFRDPRPGRAAAPAQPYTRFRLVPVSKFRRLFDLPRELAANTASEVPLFGAMPFEPIENYGVIGN